MEPSVDSQPLEFSIIKISMLLTSVGSDFTVTSISTGISVKSSPATGRPQTVIVLSVDPIPSSTSIVVDMKGYSAKPNSRAAKPRYMKTFQRALLSAS